jgi:hypothetical protein
MKTVLTDFFVSDAVEPVEIMYEVDQEVEKEVPNTPLLGLAIAGGVAWFVWKKWIK